MKRILTATAIAATLAAGNAQAAQATQPFNVVITLASTCTLSAVADLTFAYTSMQAGSVNALGGGFSVTCTTSLPYSFALVQGTPAGPFTPPFATSIPSVTDNAVQLNYSLGLSATTGIGNGAAQNYGVTGLMAGGQVGTCNSASCVNTGSTNKTHTLILNY